MVNLKNFTILLLLFSTLFLIACTSIQTSKDVKSTEGIIMKKLMTEMNTPSFCLFFQ
ncbi:hypothetical protein BACCIP111883_00827 [Sutcliffiella rhizosphaerae]|uniref:Lipoprotein n=1 Tax=Sutcliffiella rhizosphaerae TaxID=2880967 RepID=A0ABM8YJE8_9BACI|nr:hypothetical protein BACCIP111883_00827 [Sutcliffiella rhizosphaerae]